MGTLEDAYWIWEKEMRVFSKHLGLGIMRSFLMPVLWLVIFGNVFGGTVSNVPIALVNDDHGAYADTFAGLLTQHGTLEIAADTNYAHALELLENRAVTAVVLIPPGFSDSIKGGRQASVKVSVDSTTPLLASTVNGVMQQASASFSNKVMLEYAGPSQYSVLQPLEVQENVLFGRGMRYIDFMAAGVIVQVIVFSSMFVGGMGLIMDREIGTLKMLMAAPIPKSSIVLGKVLGGVTQSMISGIIALCIAMAIGVQIKTGLWGIALVILLLTLISFGFIGMVIAFAARIRGLENFAMAVQTLIMPLWFLSGSLYPIETIPAWLKPIAMLNPLTYATDAVRSVMLRGVIWTSFSIDIFVLIAFSVAMLALGASVFKRTLE